MSYRRILTIQDLSCVGQCSLTVALPILSACGLETAVLPSALLSTHTAKCFEGFTFMDLTDEFPDIMTHWNDRAISFSGMLTGYLGNEKQIDYIRSMAENLLVNGPLIVDPAMADNGSLYTGFDTRYVAKMRELVSVADYILPNITEACLLTNIPYKDTYDRQYIQKLMDALHALGAKKIILTGVSFSKSTCGAAVFEGETVKYYEHKRVAQNFHGTGDIFSAVFAGAILQRQDAFTAAAKAADFVVMSMENTIGDTSHEYGVKFEPFLHLLYDSATNGIPEPEGNYEY